MDCKNLESLGRVSLGFPRTRNKGWRVAVKLGVKWKPTMYTIIYSAHVVDGMLLVLCFGFFNCACAGRYSRNPHANNYIPTRFEFNKALNLLHQE